jgi:hypothetical protein
MIRWNAGALIAASLIAGSVGAATLDAPGKQCNDAMLNGNYGIQMQGTRPAPGGTEQVIGVVLRNYDGRGGVTQIDNIKGSVTGIVPDRFGAGTYEVRGDCSVIIQFSPPPGVLIKEQGVIVDNGHEIRTITVVPQPIMVTAVQIRI